MYSSKKEIIKIPDLSSFTIMIKHTQTNRKSHFHEITQHTHKELEIYINLSGDVSFFVENRLYRMNRGDVIIAYPGEYHHCVYRSDADHTFFWILLDIDKNEYLLQFFKDLNVNFISASENSKNEIIDLCYGMFNKDLSDVEKFYYLLRFIIILKTNEKNNISLLNNLPEDFLNILEYINEHISEELKIINIADTLHLSESTIERRFKEYLGIKPLEYIQKKKMILAAELLSNGESVLNTGLSVGYSDNSYFIKLFKTYYGITPFQYKKQKKNPTE